VGVAIVGAILLPAYALSGPLTLESHVLLACTGVVALVSFVDDARSLPSSWRLATHAIAAVALLYALVITWNSPPSVFIRIPILLMAFVFIAGYTNAFNFMDGINGLAGFQGLITGAGTAAILWADGAAGDDSAAMVAVLAAGACAGFLPFNFPRARAFMGDVASASLGFLLAGLLTWAARDRGWQVLAAGCLLHANFILDTGITLVRRIWRGERWREAHREHFYQRLVRSGASHVAVTTLEAVLQVFSATLAVTFIGAELPWQIAAVLLVTVIWLGFFGFAEVRLRRVEKAHGSASTSG
jgi:UDP-N-acetylmuramyl pentapeptide phosphotransferase/UDP-N-acetylglucosamine-1-phosphate transferase